MDLVVFEGPGYRLIPSRFPPVHVYEGLVANDRFDEIVAVESLTNPRLQAQAHIEEGEPARIQNWNLAPFKYINPEGSRFFPSMRPALELAQDPQTALAIAIRRREAFLARTSEAPIGLDMRMLRTPVRGRFADLRDLPVDCGLERQRAAGRTIPPEADGVLFRAQERAHAECVAVIDRHALDLTVQTTHYRFEWDGTRISRIYAFSKRGDEIDPAKLFGRESILAA